MYSRFLSSALGVEAPVAGREDDADDDVAPAAGLGRACVVEAVALGSVAVVRAEKDEFEGLART